MTLQKLDIWNYLDNMLSKFTCLDVRHWRGYQGQTRGPWFYKKESLMTPEQVGEWLNVTAGTVRRLIRNGYLKATQIYTHVDSEQLRDAANKNPLSDIKKHS